MNYFGRKIYYDKLTGNILVDKGETEGTHITETTTEQDFETYASLAERVPETVGMIQLEYGQYAQDFTECNGYRVNPETLQLEFSYSDPTQPEPQEPVYRKPLSEEVTEIKQRTSDLELAMASMLGGAV